MATASTPPTGTISLKWADPASGEFHRSNSQFRDHVSSSAGAQFPAESGRYHLYVSHACPWAHRTMIVRALKGLQSVISVSVVDWLLGENGWKFSTGDECPGAVPDTECGAKFLRELYFMANPAYTGRFTVPVLWDKQQKTIVNNESSEILRMLNSEFNAFSTQPELDLYPVAMRAEIDAINAWVYDEINNGVYKAGFATKQEPYEKHCRTLFAALDRVEVIFQSKKYLVGDQLTEADVRLFTTILRFDPVYHGHFKCNLKNIECGYPHILKWLRRMYQLPGVATTVNMTHIKHHYYESHVNINPTRVVPLNNGPDLTSPVALE